ncbi:MAG: FHA domain-containing protein [Hyphomicrobiaceae bacterium]
MSAVPPAWSVDGTYVESVEMGQYRDSLLHPCPKHHKSGYDAIAVILTCMPTNNDGSWTLNSIPDSSNREKYTIGRAASCDVVLEDLSISRIHCILTIELDGTFTLTDASSSGTRVGGILVRDSRVKVVPSDTLLIGRFETTVSELLLQLQRKRGASTPSKNKIFISYRREDTEQTAGRMFDDLTARFGVYNIFFDTEAIPGAVDFRLYIQSALRESCVVVALIGERWLRRAPLRAQIASILFRRDVPDFVAVELELAIAQRVPIVPVLIGGAGMPPSHLLAKSIQAITNLNAVNVRVGRYFKSDMDALARVLADYHQPIGSAQISEPINSGRG